MYVKNVQDEWNASVPITAQLRGWYTLDACGENDINASSYLIPYTVSMG